LRKKNVDSGKEGGSRREKEVLKAEGRFRAEGDTREQKEEQKEFVL